MIPQITKILTPYQLDWLRDKEAFLVCTKSRRIGISYAEALKSIILATKENNPRNTYYVSYNYQAAKNWLSEDVGYWLEKFQIMAKIDTNYMLFNESQREPIQVSKVTFKNGKSIIALPSRPEVFRGLKGRMVLDEANYIVDLQGMITAAKASLFWGNGQISVISTQGDADGDFNQLVEAVEAGNKQGSLHKIDLLTACQQGLYKKICQESGQDWRLDLEQNWIKDVLAEYHPYEDTELLCLPSRSGDRVFNHEILLNSIGTGELIIRKDFTDTTNPAQVTSALVNSFHKEIKPHLEAFNIGRNVTAEYIGADIGRSSDLSSFYVLADDAVSGKLLTCLIVELKGAPFDSQKELLKLIISNLTALKSGAVDAVGIGADIAESITFWNPKIQAVKANATYHDREWIKLLRLFEKSKISIPNDSLLFKDLGMVQYIDGVPRLSKRREGGRHGDSASSLQLAISTIELEQNPGLIKQPGMIWSPRQKQYIRRV